MQLSNNTDYDTLLNLMVEQASLFLDELEHFVPFGATLTTDGIVIPLGVFIDHEMELIDQLALIRDAIAQKYAAGEIRAAAVGQDVNFRMSPDETHRSAIYVALTHAQEAPLDYYFIYALTAGKSKIQQCLYYPGSLSG